MIKLLTIWFLVVCSAWANLNFTTYHIPSWPPSIQSPGLPLSTGTVTSINHNWGGGQVLNSGSSDRVLVNYTGWINWAGAAGQQKTITFYAVTDDGFKMTVGGNTIINNIEGLHGPAYYNYTASTTLTAGNAYYLNVWFAEWTGGAVAQLFWDLGDGAGIVAVPTSAYMLTAPEPAPAPVYSSSISQAQQTRVTSFVNRVITDNAVYIDQAGDDNQINITQTGRRNLVSGVGKTAAQIQGNTNSVNIRQGWNGADTEKNQIELRVTGSVNQLNLNQAVNSLGQGGQSTGGHYQLVSVVGNQNSVTVDQINAGSGNHYLETSLIGSNNSVTLHQNDNTGKLLFMNLQGNQNLVQVMQKGTGNHLLDLNLVGDSHTVNVVQEGALQNRATVELINAGGAVNFSLNQTGLYLGQVYSISQTCVNPAGCGVIVSQP